MLARIICRTDIGQNTQSSTSNKRLPLPFFSESNSKKLEIDPHLPSVCCKIKVAHLPSPQLDHTSHGSVSVVRTTFKVYGKMQTLTLSQPKSPEPIVTKF